MKSEKKSVMNILRDIFRRYGIFFFVPIPWFVGMVGFFHSGDDFWDSAFTCVSFYFMGYTDAAPNLWIQVGRWLAPLATASGLAMVFSSVSRCLARIHARLNRRSVGVYGTEPEKSELLWELGCNGIAMEDSAVRAGSYILVGSEEENLAFYQHNAATMDGKDVYMKCFAISEQSSTDAKLHLFSPEETAVRNFWKEYCIYDLARSLNHRLKIAIFGFGKLGNELLTQGLQYNIFSPDQVMEYHIFGHGEGYKELHPQLSQISDPVEFHEEPWYQSRQLLTECNMMIVLQQENQLQLLQDLIRAYPEKSTYVFSNQTNGVAMLEKTGGIISYDWKARAMQLGNILGIRTHWLAKKLNLRYAHLYGGVEETEENMEAEWRKLNAFTRYSNISSANFHHVCMRILDGQELTPERLRLLGELEHIRWCRYHFLNNWKYGVPENGKAKDTEKRIHQCLVPNAQLSEAEQEKDRENVRMLMELQAGN